MSTPPSLSWSAQQTKLKTSSSTWHAPTTPQKIRTELVTSENLLWEGEKATEFRFTFPSKSMGSTTGKSLRETLAPELSISWECFQCLPFLWLYQYYKNAPCAPCDLQSIKIVHIRNIPNISLSPQNLIHTHSPVRSTSLWKGMVFSCRMNQLWNQQPQFRNKIFFHVPKPKSI